MRHSNKHHHRQKDQKNRNAAIFNHAYSQLFSSAENRSLSYKTRSKWSSGRKPQLRLYSLLNVHDHSQLADPILPGKPLSSLPGKILATNTGCKRRNKAGSSVFKELLSFQLPPQPFTVAVRFGRGWRSREIWRLRLPHCSYQPCTVEGSPAAVSLSASHWYPTAGVAFEIPQGKSTNGQMTSGEAQH